MWLGWTSSSLVPAMSAVASWPPVKGLSLPSGSASVAKKSAVKNDDDIDDLFGEDDGDAEAAAAAA